MTTMAENVLATDKATAQATILKRCVCLVLRCPFIGNQRKVPLADIDLKETVYLGNGETTEEDVKADKDELRLTKQLLDRKDLKQAKAVQESAKAYLRSIATQGHRVFGAGTYLIPNVVLLETIERLKLYRAELQVAVDELVKRYPAMVEKRKAALKELFSAKDYLSEVELRAEFDIAWTFTSFSAPDQLEDVDRALYEAVKAQKEQDLESAYNEVVVQMRAAALKVMTELADRLKSGPDGKPKVLRGTALRDLQDFVDLLPKRDIIGDEALAQAIKKVSDYSEGLDVSMLKSAPAVRATLQELAEEASHALSGLVETARKRAISFGDVR